MKFQVISPVADVYGAPDTRPLRGKFETQLVLGEIFIGVEEKKGWCKGACAHDGYAGYVETRHLAKSLAPATHIVTAARSHAYRDATIKSQHIGMLSFGSLVTITASDRGWAQMDGGAWLYPRHLAPVDTADTDYIATARKFLETPYYWGGRSGFGIDCSGLVQVSLARAGIRAPRDTEMQKDALGAAADTTKAGDIVFFPGHVGLMVDERHLIHANAFHMKVVIEPVGDVISRSEGITSIRRL